MDTLLSGRWTGNVRAALTLTYGRYVISTDTILVAVFTLVTVAVWR